MEGLILLRRAREAGLHVHADGDQVVVRGPRRLEPLAVELLLHRDEILDLLTPPARGPWPTQTYPLTVEIFAVRTLADLAKLRPNGQPPARCYNCQRAAGWWRAKGDPGPWRCQGCVPQAPGPDLDTWPAGEGRL
jgi:hypothetical protein